MKVCVLRSDVILSIYVFVFPRQSGERGVVLVSYRLKWTLSSGVEVVGVTYLLPYLRTSIFYWRVTVRSTTWRPGPYFSVSYRDPVIGDIWWNRDPHYQDYEKNKVRKRIIVQSCRFPIVVNPSRTLSSCVRGFSVCFSKFVRNDTGTSHSVLVYGKDLRRSSYTTQWLFVLLASV